MVGSRQPSSCARCEEQGVPLIGSYFDTSMTCMRCNEIERNHPDYERANEVETQAVRDGNYNFKGIGVPAGLIQKCRAARKAQQGTA